MCVFINISISLQPIEVEHFSSHSITYEWSKLQSLTNIVYFPPLWWPIIKLSFLYSRLYSVFIQATSITSFNLLIIYFVRTFCQFDLIIYVLLAWFSSEWMENLANYNHCLVWIWASVKWSFLSRIECREITVGLNRMFRGNKLCSTM